MEPHTVRHSQVEMCELVLPNDANTHGAVLGGRVMHHIDIAAAIAAGRHSGRGVVTAAIDEIEFLHPVKVGHLLILKASVNFAHRSSMEVGVKVWSENVRNGERRHTSSAFLTFVALDDHGRPIEVPPLQPETEVENQRFEAGRVRRDTRLRHRQEKKERRAAASAPEAGEESR